LAMERSSARWEKAPTTDRGLQGNPLVVRRRCSLSMRGTLRIGRNRVVSADGRIVRTVVALERFQERRRAAALARHYRDQESLTIAEIVRRLGRTEGTGKAYLYDPSQANKRPRCS
jgi:hypothetical protein